MALPCTQLVKQGADAPGTQYCPNCRAILVQSLVHGRMTHTCPKGHGRAYSASSVRAWIAEDYQVDFGLMLEKGKTGTRDCSRCHKRFKLSRFYGLLVEHCHGCSLVWLNDGLAARMPFRPEREREHAGSSVHIPVKVKFDPGLEVVEDLYSPFEGVRYGEHTAWATLCLAFAFALLTACFWYLDEPSWFIAAPREPLRYFGLPLLLSIFAHADLPHLFGNCYFLFVAGSVLESNLGWKRYLTLFGCCAVGARIAQAFNTDLGSIGASGAVSGVVIALVATQPKAFYVFRPWGTFLGTPLLGNLVTLSLRVPIWLWAFCWFGLDFYLMTRKGSYDGVGHAAHLGGAVAGAFLASQPYFQGPHAPPKKNQKAKKPKRLLAKLSP